MGAAFKVNSFLSFLLSVSVVLSGCGNAVERLPDDPDTEATPIEREGVTDLPSETPAPVLTTPITTVPETPVPVTPPDVREDKETSVLSLYDHLDPNRIVPEKALREAVVYYHANKSKFPNSNVLSVIDFNQSSTQKRFYVIDLKTGAVWNLHVSHGKGSDSNHDGFAEKFSNVPNSNATSLGFYKTAETYQGKHGYSLRLDGLSTTNSKARARAIVIHGATYVQDKAVIQGRSWGCPAISMANHKTLINRVKGGSLIYAVGGGLTQKLADFQE